MSGKRPDDWSFEQLQEMAEMAERFSKQISKVVQSMREGKIDSLVLQARKKKAALDELVTWARFDLEKALDRQAMMREKGASVAENAKKNRRK